MIKWGFLNCIDLSCLVREHSDIKFFEIVGWTKDRLCRHLQKTYSYVDSHHQHNSSFSKSTSMSFVDCSACNICHVLNDRVYTIKSPRGGIRQCTVFQRNLSNFSVIRLSVYRGSALHYNLTLIDSCLFCRFICLLFRLMKLLIIG